MRAALALGFALPLIAALVLALRAGTSSAAWGALWTEPQLQPALATSIGIALASTLLSLLLALSITTALHGTRGAARLARWLAPMLATPHAAFAIGFAVLVMPSGVLARLLAPLAGWDSPPPWGTVNDRWGIGMTLVLVAKEVPFLLWNIAALLQRREVAEAVQRQLAIARSFGYSAASAWWRVLWPQWLPRLTLPLLAVLAYSLSVVDVALIIGPGAPPTLAVLGWQWLQDAEPARNAQGAAAALLLAVTLLVLCALLFVAACCLGALWRARVRRGLRPHNAAGRAGGAWAACAGALAALYALVLALLVAMSFAGVWTFPSLMPQAWSTAAWRTVLASASTVGFTAALAAAASTSALVLVVAWLEATPQRWDARVASLVMLPLVVPGLLLVTGLYEGALWLRLDGTHWGLWWVHTLMVLPYVMVTLAPAWRSFDARYEWTALALGRSRAAFWWHVKWSMLLAPLAAAAAVGFAVSVAQYLPTLFIGAGRHATLTTEAVTLASGGQRTLAAAFAFLQALLPVLGFGLAHALTRRQRHWGLTA